MLLKLALIGLFAVSVETIFTKDEVETVLSSLRLLKIRHCILSSEIIDDTAKTTAKKLNENLIFTGFFRLKNLEEYIKVIKPPDGPIAIVIKTDKSSHVKDVFVKNYEKLFWFVWFLITDDDLDPRIRIPYNCQFFQIKKDSHRTYRLVDNYHVKNGSNIRKEFGFWSPENGLTTGSLHIYKRRMDMEGVQLHISLCKRYDVEEILEIFWLDLARIYNFSVKMELEMVKKTARGYVPLQNPDASSCIWGITGLELYKKWMFLTSGEKVKLTMKFRGTNDIGWRAYVQPFTSELWLAVILWLLVSTVAIVIVNGCNRETLYLNLFTGFFCLCNSDPTAVYPAREPLPTATKLVNLMVIIVPAVLIPAYSAYILSTLSIIRPLEPFINVKGFIDDSTYTLTAVNHSFTIRYLILSKDPQMKYIYNNLFVGVDNVAPTFFALFEQLCRDQKLVGLFIDSKSFRNHFRCRMFIVPQEIVSVSTGVLLPKDSPFQKMLNERSLIIQHKERGIRKAVLEKKKTFHEAGLNALNMSQMQAIFFLVPLGIFLALIVLGAEFAVKSRFQQTTKNVSFTSGAEQHTRCSRHFQNEKTVKKATLIQYNFPESLWFV